MINMIKHIPVDPEGDPENLALTFPASDSAVEKVLAAEVGDDGRSGWEWIRLSNGDLILGVFPTGEGYFDVELDVEADYRAAERGSPIPRR